MTELTDAGWDELVRDLRARVARYAPDWTDVNDSDPGITLVELFAFLAEPFLGGPDGSPRARARLREIVEQLERAHATRCPDATLVRNRYFTGKLMSAADFEQEQSYNRTKHRRHNRLLHGVGIVRGLEVGVEPGQPGEDPVVVVSPGVAIDARGEELVVCERVTADVCPGKAVCYVTVRLVERPTNVVAGGEASSVEGICGDRRARRRRPGTTRHRTTRPRRRHLAARPNIRAGARRGLIPSDRTSNPRRPHRPLRRRRADAAPC